jgi:hypothetical protein
MNNPHTPGNWKVIKDPGRLPNSKEIQTDDGQVIAEVFTDVCESAANARLIAKSPALLQVAKNALAELEGIMPEFEPSGDREHPGWETIRELKETIASATNQFESFKVVAWVDDCGDIVEASDEEADGFSVYATLKDGSSVLMETFDVDYDTEELPAETETEWQERIVREARQLADGLAASLTKTYIEAI